MTARGWVALSKRTAASQATDGRRLFPLTVAVRGGFRYERSYD
jgi:hypothetical protein